MTTETTFQELINDGYDRSSLCDAATWQSLVEWFGLRRVQPNFDRFFSRALKIHYGHYRELLRIEPSIAQYDWFVENYKEQQSTYEAENEKTTSNEISGTKTGLKGGTVTIAGTDGNTRTLNTQDDTTQSGTNGHSGTSSNNMDSVSRTTDATRNQPMSQSFIGSRTASAGLNTKSMAWGDITNPTTSEDNLSDTSEVGGTSDSYTDTNSETGRKTQTGTVTDAGTRSSTTTNNLTNSETDSKTEEGSVSDNSQSVTRTVLKGRDKGISELLREASDVIKDTESFLWFTEQLETCFMSCY